MNPVIRIPHSPACEALSFADIALGPARPDQLGSCMSTHRKSGGVRGIDPGVRGIIVSGGDPATEYSKESSKGGV